VGLSGERELEVCILEEGLRGLGIQWVTGFSMLCSPSDRCRGSEMANKGYSFLAYEYTKRLLRYEEVGGGEGGSGGPQMASMKILLAGGVAGCISWLSVYPLDVIKTRVQAQGECEGLLGKRRLGTWACAKSAYAEGGGRVFFNGLGVCMARAFLVRPL